MTQEEFTIEMLDERERGPTAYDRSKYRNDVLKPADMTLWQRFQHRRRQRRRIIDAAVNFKPGIWGERYLHPYLVRALRCVGA